jgi:L-fucose mutarotase
MLKGIHPLLTGQILMKLDEMGHSDSVVVADAHFPAWRIGKCTIDLPGARATDALAALRTVLPLDDTMAMALMEDDSGQSDQLHRELAAAAGATASTNRALLARAEFYTAASRAYLILRTGETRPFANSILFKGLVTPTIAL